MIFVYIDFIKHRIVIFDPQFFSQKKKLEQKMGAFEDSYLCKVPSNDYI